MLVARDCPVVNPVLIHRPPYPNISGPTWNGVIRVQMTIDKTGTPQNLQIVQTICSGNPERDSRSDCKGAEKIALDFVAQWQFRPASKCGDPIEFPATASVDFNTHHQ
jgi:hypothetical protein